MIFKQETIKSWFSGVGTSVNNEVIQPFQNANSVINKYNLAIQQNSLTQQGWQRLLAQSDDSLKTYLTSIKGSTASMAGYNISLQGSITGFTKVSNAIKQYNTLGTVSLKEQQAFATAVRATNSKLGTYLIGLNGSTAGLRGYGVSLVTSTAKTIGLTVATTSLNAAMTMGISVIVTGLISAFTAWINKSQEIAEKAQEAADKINSISEGLKTNTETVENAKRRYAELAQEVENLGKITQSQGTLSNEEYEEFLDLSNQLAGIFPSLTKNYDKNGNAILDLSGDVNTIVVSLDNLIQKEKELANQKIMEEFPDVFKGYTQDVSDAEAKVKSAQTEFDKINNAYQQLSRNGSAVQAFDLNLNGVFTNENGEKVKTTMNEYTQALEDLGIAYKKTNIMLPNRFGIEELSGYRIEATGDIDVAFTSKLEEARENLQYAQQQLEGEKSSINSYLNTWLQGEFSYLQIEDSGLQTAIQDMLFNFDFSNIPEDKRGDWNYVSEYLRRNILFEINNVQDDPVISKALSEVFTNTELTPSEKSNYLQQIQDYFGEGSSIVISLKPQIDETETLQKQYDKAIEDTKAKFDDYDPTVFFKENSINTKEEVDKWLEIAQAANSAVEAEERYLAIDASLFSSFDNTDFGDRLQHITDLFDEGSITVKQYFDALQTEINNFDASNFTESIEDMNKASEQFFIDSVQQTANGLSDLIDSFDSNEMSISEYLEGYLAIGNTLNTLTDSLQENSALWNENGEAISSAENTALDETQAKLANAMATIQSYQDSIYSLEQIMTNSVEAGSEEFSAHAQVIAQDLYNIVQSGGLMADEIKNRLGSTTSEIALSLTESVANQELACQAITDNTNNEITDMATAIGELFDTLGNAISNFKVDLSFGVKSIDWEKVNVLGIDLSLPKIKFELGASGESLEAIGDAVASFGKAISSNYGKQTINLEDYHFGDTDGAGKGKYTPSPGIVSNYKNALDNIKDSDSTESTSQTAEKLNWIERLINKISTAYNRLKNVVSNTAETWLTRNNALSDSMQTLLSEIDAQSKAYDYYMNLFNSYGLDEYYKNQIANGSISIEVIYDDNLKEAISECIDLYDNAQEAKDAVDELTQEYRSLAMTRFDNLKSEYEAQIGLIEDTVGILEAQLSLLETDGYINSKYLYNSLIEAEKENLKNLNAEYAALSSKINTVEEGSENWYSMKTDINSVSEAIINATDSLKGYENELRQIEWDLFDRTRDDVADLIDESDFLYGILEDKGFYDDGGNLNRYGQAAQAMLAQKYELYASQSKAYADEVKKIDEELAKDPYSTDLIDRRQELIKLQQESVQSALDEKNAMKDLISEGYEEYKNSLDDIISKYKDLLSTIKDTYDYEKNIAGLTDNLAALEKQYQAYQGDNSESGRKNVQQLKTELEDARQDLKETEYEKLISDTEKLLDEFQTDVDEWLNERLDHLDVLISDVISQSNTNTGAIAGTINEAANSVGYTLSDNMNGIWAVYSGNITNALSEIGNEFTSGQSALHDTVKNIGDSVLELLKYADEEAAGLIAEQGSQANGGSDTGSQTEYETNTRENPASGGGNAGGDAGSSDWAIYKYYYPQDLNVDTSVVDRLKSHNIDASFDARSRYWDMLIGDGEYYSTYEQNVRLLNWLKNNRYAKGSRRILFDQLGLTQERGQELIFSKTLGGMITPLRRGDKVFTSEMTENLWKLAQKPVVPDVCLEKVDVPNVISRDINNIDVGGINIEVKTDNPQDFARQIKKQLATDNYTKKIIQEIALGGGFNHSSMQAKNYI